MGSSRGRKDPLLLTVTYLSTFKYQILKAACLETPKSSRPSGRGGCGVVAPALVVCVYVSVSMLMSSQIKLLNETNRVYFLIFLSFFVTCQDCRASSPYTGKHNLTF